MLSTNESDWINKEATMVTYARKKLASRHHALPRASWWRLSSRRFWPVRRHRQRPRSPSPHFC